MVPASEQSEAGQSPGAETFEAMGRFNQEMIDAGIMLAADGLAPSSKGAKIRFERGTTTVVDGPFTESKELIGGYWIINVKSRDEAVAWMRRAPFGDGTVLQLRQIYEMDDLVDLFGEEVVEKARRRRRAFEERTKPA
jgi:hypothetical protein